MHGVGAWTGERGVCYGVVACVRARVWRGELRSCRVVSGAGRKCVSLVSPEGVLPGWVWPCWCVSCLRAGSRASIWGGAWLKGLN